MEYGIKVNNIKQEDINTLKGEKWAGEDLQSGQIVNGIVTGINPYGAFIQIENGAVGYIHIEDISVARIKSPFERLSIGQNVKVVVKYIDSEQKRVTLSYKEILGTWEENAAYFSAGETVGGIIRSVEDYGVFVELAPNLAGLAESCSRLKPGQQASVYIKSLIPEKMKIKLIIVDSFDGEAEPKETEYFITKGHIDFWQYSPENCSKKISTVF